MTPEERAFQARIDAAGTVEARDWMPAAYRESLIQRLSQSAHSEVISMLVDGGWITRAPTLKRKMTLLSKIQEEGGHGLHLYSAAETLGTTREAMLRMLHSGKAGYGHVLNYPVLTWGDVGAFGWLVDGALLLIQARARCCSYGPLARAMERICKEEGFHVRHGHEIMAALCRGTAEQKAMAQDAVNRWWWPTLMVFGPPETESEQGTRQKRWRLQLFGSDALRQRFIDRTAPQVQALGLTLPDPALKWNEEQGHYDFGPIDWEEFFRVLTGNGPCSRQRLKAASGAYEDGRWVREAAAAHAERRAARRRPEAQPP